jgi:hypothetical protein
VAFGTVVVAHGNLAQLTMRRLTATGTAPLGGGERTVRG